ncbi:MAG: hypothetical protein FWC40_01925 [Proteobacteria bacterium]|nr:hypothetical protein [Pseudomonadota bacterium]
MKKVVVALFAVAVAFGTMACSKDKKTTQAPAAPAEETLQQLEALYQLNDPASRDPKAALTCRYVLITNNGGTLERKEASIKTSGQCDFDSLKGKVSSSGALSIDKATQILNIIKSTAGLGANAKARFDCVAYNIKTSVRMVGLQDCSIKDPSAAASGKAASAKEITKILGL